MIIEHVLTAETHIGAGTVTVRLAALTADMISTTVVMGVIIALVRTAEMGATMEAMALGFTLRCIHNKLYGPSGGMDDPPPLGPSEEAQADWRRQRS